MKNYFFCLDVGGTDIKGGIIDEAYNIMFTEKISSKTINSSESLKSSILNIIDLLEKKSKLKISKSLGLGIAFPGLVDCNTGNVEYLPNLGIKQYNIIEALKQDIAVPIKIANDAELALLAEHKIGSGKGFDNIAMLTLGTGVGLGLMINGKNLRSSLPYSSEYGHNLFNDKGDSLEHVISTKALIQNIKSAMQNNPKSKMWTKYNLDTVTGKTLFDFKDKDITAKAIFNDYISNLGKAIVNIYNVFTPDVTIIGGGISQQGLNLITPLEDYVNTHTFLSHIGKRTKIVTAKFLNDAGILGARCLFD